MTKAAFKKSLTIYYASLLLLKPYQNKIAESPMLNVYEIV